MEAGATEGAGDRFRVEAEGATVEDAQDEALWELAPEFPGLRGEHVRFEVLSERAGAVLVEAIVDEERWAEEHEEVPEDPAERVEAIVVRVVDALGLRANVAVAREGDEIRATVDGEDVGLLIGRHGQTIDAVQHVASRAVFGGEERLRVVVDAAGYRARREEQLCRDGDRAADEALDSGRPVPLEPMNAFERRIVHEHLRDRPEVETYSEGDEPERRLVVSPAGSA